MTYRDAIKEVLQEEIRKQHMRPARVSAQAGYANNFLGRFFSGAKREITPDALAPIAGVLGVSVGTIITSAESKKQHTERAT